VTHCWIDTWIFKKRKKKHKVTHDIHLFIIINDLNGIKKMTKLNKTKIKIYLNTKITLELIRQNLEKIWIKKVVLSKI